MNLKNLDPTYKQAWISFFVAHGRITRLIDDRLKAANQVSMDVYDVLVTLETAPDQRLIMSELADKVLLTRSGMTRMTDRLEKAGLIRRIQCPADRRALYLTITEKGLRERENAWVVYQQAVIELFAKQITLEEAQTMDRALGKVLTSLEVSNKITQPVV